MNLGDALHGAFAAREEAERGRERDPNRTVRSIHRRRVAYAAGTGTAAAVGVGAVGAIWLTAPGGASMSPGQSAPSTECTDAQLYLPPNPEALGGVEIAYRAYVDIRPDSPTHGVVVVEPDGSLVRVEPGADGSYEYQGMPLVDAEAPDSIKYEPVVWDMTRGGGGGDRWDGVSPHTNDYEWTIVIPPEVPEGVSTELLASTLRIAIGSGGNGFLPGSVPDGAVADAVLTTTSGVTVEARLEDGDPGLSTDERTDIASVAIRVTLADGGTFTITAEHHEVDPALTACASTTGSTSVTATPTGSPSPAPTGVLPGSSPDSGVSQGAVPELLEGPEAQVFACGAPLPEDLEGTLGLNVGWASGEQAIVGWIPVTYDFGDGGVVVEGELPYGGPLRGELLAYNWLNGGTEGEDSLAAYVAVVAVKDGTVVGLVNPSTGGEPSDWFNSGGPGSAPGTGLVSVAITDVVHRMEPCPGHVERELAGATTVALLGSGAVGGPYEFAWTAVERP